MTTLDLSRRELAGLVRLRVVLAMLDAITLDLEASAVMLRPDRRETLRVITGLLATGIIEVRAAPLAGWAPDFSVFRDADGPFAVLLGSHWFQRPYPHRGPALAALHGQAGATLALSRFEDVWRSGHDISPAVLGILERARGRSGAP